MAVQTGSLRRWLSNVAILTLVAATSFLTIGAMVVDNGPHGTYGMSVAWRREGGRALVVDSVAEGGPAALAGIRSGDRIAAFGSPLDRMKLILQAGLSTGSYVPAGQELHLTILRGASARRVTLRAAAFRLAIPGWFFAVRLTIYLLGVLIGGVLVLLRPSAITWCFALFVILAQQPNVWQLEYVGLAASAPAFLIALFALVPCTTVVGMLGLVGFAARFPENTPHPGHRRIETAVQAFMLLLVAAYAQYYVGQLYGVPSLTRAELNDTIFFAPALVAVALLLASLRRSPKQDRARFAWALLGPSLGTFFTVLDAAFTAANLPSMLAAAMGVLANFTPYAMLYAILRHRVIDVEFALNKALARAVSERGGATGTKPDRRDLVRRTSLLLSAKLPLDDIYAQLATLLAQFVDATSVLIAVGNAEKARLEYNFEDGIGGKPDNAVVPPDSIVGGVLRSGASVLVRHAGEWPNARIVRVAGRETKPSESGIFVPILFGGSIAGVISVQSRVPEAYDEHDVSLLETCALYLGARICGGEQSLESLTEFQASLAQEWKRCAQARSWLSVLLVDADLLGAFNETYGHVAGDTCLTQIGGVVAACAQLPRALVTRYSSHVFAVLLADAQEERAIGVAECIREGVARLAIEHQGSSLGRVSVSVGIVCEIPTSAEEPASILARAGVQLHRAKECGKNRACGEAYESQAPAIQRRAPHRGRLPVARDALIGRAPEIEEIGRALPVHPLVTLTGPTGCGKTRLALEVATRYAERYPDGVWFIDLSEVATQDAVAPAIAGTVFPGLDLEVDAVRLAELLRGKEALLVIDDCSRLRDSCARIFERFAQEAPRVRVLAAAGKPLGVRGESALPVPALTLEESMTLFARRARLAGTDLGGAQASVLRAIAERLGGNPLAIEFAATLSSPRDLEELERALDAMSDVTPAALLQWIYDRCTSEEQAVFRRMAVFAGTASEPAVSCICAGAGITGERAGAILSALCERSLLVCSQERGTLRSGLDETRRSFAEAELRRSGDERATALAHVRYFSSYARELGGRRAAMPFEQWSQAQRSEFDNYRRAVTRALGELHEYDAAGAILASLRGLLVEFSARFPLSGEVRKTLRYGDLSPVTQATLWLSLSELRLSGAAAESLRAARRARELFAEAGDDEGAAYAVWQIAVAQLRENGHVAASSEPSLVAALETARRSGDRHLIAGLACNLARLQADAGRRDEARRTLHEAALLVDRTDSALLAQLLAATAREELARGDAAAAIGLWRQAAALVEESRPIFSSLCLVELASAELIRGNPIAARGAVHRGLATLRSAGHKFGIASCFDLLARLAMREGALERAARIAGFAQSAFERGPARPLAEQRHFYALVDELRARLDRTVFEREWNRGQWMTLDEAMREISEITRSAA
jgi:diguanylate cyclase (GGDEF)-like protein